MSSSLQSLLALLVVALAAGWLLWRSWKKRSATGCGGDCGCPSKLTGKRP